MASFSPVQLPWGAASKSSHRTQQLIVDLHACCKSRGVTHFNRDVDKGVLTPGCLSGNGR